MAFLCRLIIGFQVYLSTLMGAMVGVVNGCEAESCVMIRHESSECQPVFVTR